MCLVIFAHQVSPDYPLIVAANRDEFYARPTAASAFWTDYPDVLAGRDIQAGGTWMGVSRSGRFAAVTNYRDPSRTLAAPRSRGELPLHYLAGTQAPDTFLAEVSTHADDYAGFSLLLGDRLSLWYFTNSDVVEPRSLLPGVYGLSNASLDTPWPKVELGRVRLGELLTAGPMSHDALARVVADRQLATQTSAADKSRGDTMESILSAQFIVTETYGTRSSTTLWTDASGDVNWREQSFNEQGVLRDVQQRAFRLSSE